MADQSQAHFRSLVSVTADATSPASATFAVTTGVAGFAAFKAITFIATITGGTGGALDVLIEHSPDGVAWYEYCHFTQVAAAATKTFTYSPSFSGAIKEVGKNNAAGNTLSSTMVLTAGQVSDGHWFDQLRIRYVAGASTSAGAAQAIGVLCVSESGQS